MKFLLKVTEKFMFSLYSTTSDFNGREFTIIYKIIYEKSNEVLLLHLS